jgi:hypothetical protein
MQRLGWMVGLTVIAVACGTAGDMAGEMLDSGVPDAGAQPGDCPCEVGPQGEPGEQGPQGEPGEQGPPGEPGSGAVAASLLGVHGINSFDTGGWGCDFGTQSGEQIDVQSGQRLLISGQGFVVASDRRFEFSVAWRAAGDTTNGTLGHSLENGEFQDPMHVTELTPALGAGTYEFGACVISNTNATIGARAIYATALVVE